MKPEEMIQLDWPTYIKYFKNKLATDEDIKLEKKVKRANTLAQVLSALNKEIQYFQTHINDITQHEEARDKLVQETINYTNTKEKASSLQKSASETSVVKNKNQELHALLTKYYSILLGIKDDLEKNMESQFKQSVLILRWESLGLSVSLNN